MHRVVAIHAVSCRVYRHKTLFLITVGINHEVSLAILLVSKAEHRAMTESCHLCLEMFIGQDHRVIIGMRHLIIMTKPGGSLLGFQSQAVHQRHERERTVILRTSTHQPMTVAESLQFGVFIIVGSHTFLFSILRLRCPEIHAVGFEDSRNCLSVLLRSLAIAACRLRHSIVGSHHRIDSLNTS